MMIPDGRQHSRRVTVTPPKLAIAPELGVALETIHATAYVRTSTRTDEQHESYEAQLDYYTKLIKGNSQYVYVDIYADEKSGLVERHRKEFQRLKEDALAGKFSLVFCKSVARFSRNSEEFMAAIRLLRSVGVTVYFEEERKSTQDPANDFMLSLRVSIAQEESRNISANVKWGLQRRMEKGQVFLAYSRFLGYEKDEDGGLQIVEKEAKIVREIYHLFLRGRTYRMIADHLTGKGYPTPAKQKNWSVTTVQSILQNEKYKGCLILGKTHVKDYLTKKTVKNQGYSPRYEYHDTHPAIIPPDVHALVQAEIARRKVVGRLQSRTSVFSRKVVCGCCGGYYGAKVWHSASKYRRTVYQCNAKYHVQTPCDTPHLTEAALQDAFMNAINQVIGDKHAYLAELKARRTALLNIGTMEVEHAALVERRNDLHKSVTLLVEKNAHLVRDQQKFIDDYTALSNQYEALEKEIQDVQAKIDGQMVEAGMIRLFMEDLEKIACPLSAFDEDLWFSTVDTLLIDKNGSITVHFKCGIKIDVE